MSKSRRYILPGLVLSGLAVVAMIIFLARREQPPPGVSPKVVRFLGTHTAAIIAGATRVEAMRLDVGQHFDWETEKIKRQSRAPKLVGQYPVLMVKPIQDRKLMAKLKTAILDEKTYSFGGFDTCFGPPVGFRFWRGAESVTALLCFDCHNIAVVSDTPRQPSSDRGLVNFSAGELALLRLAKQAFPGDKEIQALSEKKAYH